MSVANCYSLVLPRRETYEIFASLLFLSHNFFVKYDGIDIHLVGVCLELFAGAKKDTLGTMAPAVTAMAIPSLDPLIPNIVSDNMHN